MKKVMLVIALVLSLSKSFAQKKTFTQPKFNQKGFVFTIDPRIELYNIMMMVIGNPTSNPEKLFYKQEIINTFSSFKQHDAITHLFSTMQNNWRDVEAPYQLFMHLNEQLNLDTVGLNGNYAERSGGMDNLVALAKDIKRFAADAGYYQFYNSHNYFYNLILNNTKYSFKDFDEKQRIEKFFGNKKLSYTIVLNILEGNGNFGERVKIKQGENLFALICSHYANGDIPSFEPDFEFYNLVYHEFSHSFCNPLVYANSGELSKYANLFEPIKESMQAQGYDNWLTVVHEHLVRASTIMLANDKFGEKVATNIFYKNEMGRRFIYDKAIVAKLYEYNANRAKFKTYKMFFPELIKVFANISKIDIEELQKEVVKMREPNVEHIPIPNDAPWDSSMVFIVSTHEKIDSLNTSINDYATKTKAMGSDKIKIITDEEAKNIDLSTNNIIAFGTVEGNSFIKAHCNDIPMIISNDYVVFKNVVKGSNFQIVVSWLNPFNKNKQMIFYTAQHAEDIHNYEWSAIKSGYNYWIGNNLVTIAKGNFARFWEIWNAN